MFRGQKKRGVNDPKLLGMAGAWAAAAQAWSTAGTSVAGTTSSSTYWIVYRKGSARQPEASELLRNIWKSDSLAQADKARGRLCKRFDTDYPEAVKTLKEDWERMVTLYDFPEEHWKHLRTTNIIESREPIRNGSSANWSLEAV